MWVKGQLYNGTFKGIVSRDFLGLQMILVDKALVPSKGIRCMFWFFFRFSTFLVVF